MKSPSGVNSPPTKSFALSISLPYSRAQLACALLEEQIDVFYSPTRQVDTGIVCGFRAMPHWASADHGLVPYTELIRAMAGEAFGPSLFCTVLLQVFRQLAHSGDKVIRVSLEESMLPVAPVFRLLSALLLESWIAPERLEMEFRGPMAVETRAMSEEMRRAGIRVGRLVSASGGNFEGDFEMSDFDSFTFWAPELTGSRWTIEHDRWLGRMQDHGKVTLLADADGPRQIEFARLKGFDLIEGAATGPLSPEGELREIMS
ncbi:hypothetical protein AEYBE204_09345 [Asticcacaulis sp. YBE204]|nr:hypothetical protein AEYBE204_09345 [Asticcacaulis sp. YBE204]